MLKLTLTLSLYRAKVVSKLCALYLLPITKTNVKNTKQMKNYMQSLITRTKKYDTAAKYFVYIIF